MYAPPLVDGANPPAPAAYSPVSALSLPPHRTLSSVGPLHAANLTAPSPSYFTASLYNLPLNTFLPSTTSSSLSLSSSYSASGLLSSSPSALSLLSSPHSSPHSSRLSGRSTPPSVSNLQAVLDAAELSEQRDSQLAEEPGTAHASQSADRTERTDAQGEASRRKRRRTSANTAPSRAESASPNESFYAPPPPPPPASLTEPVDRQTLSAAFAIPPASFTSPSVHRQWLRQRKQLFRSYVGTPLTDTDALLVALLRRIARLFAALGGGRTATGERVEQHRVERDLLLALLASELPLPLVSGLLDVSGSSVRRLLEQTSGGDELEAYLSQAKQKRATHSASSPAAAGSAARSRNLICKRTGRLMRDENAFAQSFFQRPHLAHADISTVWQEYVKESTAAAEGGGAEEAVEAKRPPLSRAHFFTLAPEERRRKRKEQRECALSVACQSCGSVKQAKAEGVSEQPGAVAATAAVTLAQSAEAPPAKRSKQALKREALVQQGQPQTSRLKKAARKVSLTSEMRALLPALLAEQAALSAQPAATSQL